MRKAPSVSPSARGDGMGESSVGEYRGLWAQVEPDYVASDLLDDAKWIVGFSL